MRKNKSSGQATLELILTLFAFFTIYFMYIQSSLGFAISNYMQYATFMGARAYESGNTGNAAKLNAANAYLTATVGTGKGRFPSILKGNTSGNSAINGIAIGPAGGVPAGGANARDVNWQWGVVYDFNVNLYLAPLVPMGGAGGAAANATSQMQSQSYLGSDTSDDATGCPAVLNAAQSRTGATKVIYDNGC